MEDYLFWLVGSLLLGVVFKFTDPGLEFTALASLPMIILWVPYLVHAMMHRNESKKGKFGTIGFWNIHKILKEEKDSLFCQQEFPRGIFSYTYVDGSLIDNFSWHASVLTYKDKVYFLDPISFVYIMILLDIFWMKTEKITFEEYMNKKP